MVSAIIRQWKRRRRAVTIGYSLARQELLHELDSYDYPWQEEFALDRFVAWCERQQGRRIIVHDQIAWPIGIFGAFVRTADADWVFVSSRLTGIHKLQATLHELAHALLGHPIRVWSQEQLAAALLDESSLVDLVGSRILYRASNASTYDEEAETFALLILSRVTSSNVPVHDHELRRRLEADRDYLP